jgi:alkanesulfonate monooxygenase SsuD/methylene tetrahydromethanopterin reductase-like flavin-dependent oxidoreductase (luciferase family)
MYSPNRLKLGLFGANCSSGLTATSAPERWAATWDDNLALARMADEAGIEFMLPIARWKGYGGATNFEGTSWETITWACGLLAQTERLTVFGTVHAPLVHPVFAAKQFVTTDHVSRGRFGLNVVCGWNQDEFDMFGVSSRDYDDLYDQGKEWVEVVKGLWERTEPFDYDGRWFRLHGTIGDPKPYGGTRPIIMNAGSSPVGRAFAVAHCDFMFCGFPSHDEARRMVHDLHARAAELGRSTSVFTAAHLICRPTRAEAEAYYAYVADELADWDAVENMVGNNPKPARRAFYERHRRRFAAGYGGYPLVGSPDDVARELAAISDAGFVGLCFNLVNYLDEFPYVRDEVLPRLERLGLREPATAARRRAG